MMFFIEVAFNAQPASPSCFFGFAISSAKLNIWRIYRTVCVSPEPGTDTIRTLQDAGNFEASRCMRETGLRVAFDSPPLTKRRLGSRMSGCAINMN